MCDDIRVDPKFLKARFERLGWTTYRLSKEVAKLRKELYNEDVEHRSLINGLNRALDNPLTVSSKTFELIIKAMDGELSVTWTNRKRKTIEETSVEKEEI